MNDFSSWFLWFEVRTNVYIKALYLQNASSLDAQRILVDADDHFVLQDAPGLAADDAKVGGHEKRSSHDGPQSHLTARLFQAEAKVTNYQLWEAKIREDETEEFYRTRSLESLLISSQLASKNLSCNLLTCS